jgi:hypothetical protein
MPIQNTSPIVIPASEEAIFESLWISKIIIDTPSPSSAGSAIIEILPYNADKKEVLNQPRNIYIQDIWKEIAETKELSDAMVKIIAAVEALENKNKG